MGVTVTVFILGVAAAAFGLSVWMDRRPYVPGKPWRFPARLVMALSLLAMLTLGAHLVSLVTGKPFQGSNGVLKPRRPCPPPDVKGARDSGPARCHVQSTDRPSTSNIVYLPAARPSHHKAARTAPLANTARSLALWVSSTRSPSAAKTTV